MESYTQQVARRAWEDLRAGRRASVSPPGPLPRRKSLQSPASPHGHQEAGAPSSVRRSGQGIALNAQTKSGNGPLTRMGDHDRAPDMYTGRERQGARESRFDSTADTRGHLANGKAQRDVQIMADITSAPQGGHHNEPSTSNWSAPSAIEARMLGITDGGGTGGTPSRRRGMGDVLTRSTLGSDPDCDALKLPRNGALTSRLPQEIIDLLLKLSRSRGERQAVAAERIRQLVHNKAVSGMIAKDSWALDIMAQVLLDGEPQASTNCCACFRHLALEDDGCERMINSKKVLTGLVSALKAGDASAKQKSAAALGNLAWHSEYARSSICRIDGVVAGLLDLLLGGSTRSKESALAALSNMTSTSSCSAAVSKSMEALGVLCEELGAGSDKAKLRAAGIVRNLALDTSTRGSLLAFPGLVHMLEKVRRTAANTETMQRAEAALNSLREEQMQLHGQGAHALHSRSITASPPPLASSRPGWTDVDCPEEEALQKLDAWLSAHGWRDIQAHLLDAGYTRYDKYSEIEPQMLALDEASGLYLHQGRTLQLVGADRYNPTLLIDIENRRVLWDFQTETQFTNPWARQHFVCKIEGRSSLVLLKRNGKVVARHDSETEISLVSPDHHTTRQSNSPGLEIEEVSTESDADDTSAAVQRPKSVSPVRSNAVAEPRAGPRAAQSSIMAAVPNMVPPSRAGWTPKMVAAGKSMPVLEKLVEWATINGWHDLQRRLLDAGKTDYSKYALHEKEMTAVPGQKDCFHFKGKVLRLLGLNRQNPRYLPLHKHTHIEIPQDLTFQVVRGMIRNDLVKFALMRCENRRLIDDYNKEILWDFEKATVFTYPWARQGLRIIKDPPIGPPKAGDKLKVLAKDSGETLVELEIPPPPLVNAKPQQPTNGPLKPLRAGHGSPAGPSTEIRNAPPSPGPPGTGASSEGKEMAEAVRRLRDFTSSKGWYELQRRLLDAGETDYREYAKIEPKMVAVPGQAQLFDFEGRQLRLKGSRKDPLLLKDASTGQVLWDRNKHTKLSNLWARDHFEVVSSDVNSKSHTVTVMDKKSGRPVCECVGEGHSHGDPFLMQAVLMESVSVVKRRNLEGMLKEGVEIVQAVRDYGNQGSGEASTHLALSTGDLILVSQRGTQGWNFGSIVMDQSKRFCKDDDVANCWGAQGWFPATYAVPVQELAMWRGSVLRLEEPSSDGTIAVHDMGAGSLFFRGIPNSFSVRWY